MGRGAGVGGVTLGSGSGRDCPESSQWSSMWVPSWECVASGGLEGEAQLPFWVCRPQLPLLPPRPELVHPDPAWSLLGSPVEIAQPCDGRPRERGQRGSDLHAPLTAGPGLLPVLTLPL